MRQNTEKRTEHAYDCRLLSSHHRRAQIANAFLTLPAVRPRSDPYVVIVLAISFIASIFFLHISAKVLKSFTR